MPRRNLNPLPSRSAPPIDSLGRLRLYIDIDKRLSIALSMLAAQRHTSKRDLVENMIQTALNTEPEIARLAGVQIAR